MSAVDILSLVHLMQFGDSMLPTGAFAFSGALEAAAQTGVVRDARTLQQYVVSALRQASTGDAVGLAFALRALCDDAASAGAPVSDAALARLGVIDLALYRRKLPEEFRDMMTKTGLKLAQLGAETTKSPLLSRWLSRITTGCTPGSYPVSLAALFAATAFADAPLRGADGAETQAVLEEGLTVYFYGVAMGLLNAALRLMRVTHLETQAVLYRSSELFEPLCARALATPLDRMTGYAPMTEILSAVHAGARVRLFMS
ncbi:urease accessory UreF family protein [uncultured Mailhella sp.]|uniref:urease accessory protein UreF n=1 Tax=uncultured Mailhella sp. TaxID=1981031 RepID=UPI0032090400